MPRPAVVSRPAQRLRSPWALSIALALTLAACAPLELPTAPALVASSLDDDSDHVLPTAPIWLDFSLPLDPRSVDGTAVMVVRGPAPPSLIEDAANPPLSLAGALRLAPGRVELDGATVRFVPTRPLDPVALHTLVVTRAVRADGAPLARAVVRPFTTAPLAEGAAVPSLVDPPEGTMGVVRNLRAVEVRFSRPVAGVSPESLALVGPGGPGGPVRAAVVAGPCPECWRILVGEALAPLAEHRLVVGPAIVDDTGAPAFAPSPPPAFVTGEAGSTRPPQIGSVIGLASSGCLVARWTTDVPADSTLCVDGACVTHAARTLVHELARPLGVAGASSFRVASRDASTMPAAEVGPRPVPPSSPRQLILTEVLTAPRGPWPAQQFVEVHNRGAQPERLGGLTLNDEGGVDPLPDVIVPAGGYALIVPSGWVYDDGLDPPPAPGTVIARTTRTRLGRDGIRIGGEAVALLELDGRTVSRFSTYGLTLARGQSAHRVESCDVVGAWAATPGGTATPGRP